jgi:hypothetical protein
MERIQVGRIFTPQGSRVEEVGVEGKGRRELLSSRGGWQAAWWEGGVCIGGERKGRCRDDLILIG